MKPYALAAELDVQTAVLLQGGLSLLCPFTVSRTLKLEAGLVQYARYGVSLSLAHLYSDLARPGLPVTGRNPDTVHVGKGAKKSVSPFLFHLRMDTACWVSNRLC